MKNGKIVFQLFLIGLGLWGIKRVFIDPQRRKSLRELLNQGQLAAAEGTQKAQAHDKWQDAWDEDDARQVLGEILAEGQLDMRSSIELAQAVAKRLWPGAHVHPSGLAAVRTFLRQEIRFEAGPDSADAHEAAVVVALRTPSMIEDVVDGRDDEPCEPLAIELASRLFPALGWDEPKVDWQGAALKQLGKLVEVYRHGVPALESSAP